MRVQYGSGQADPDGWINFDASPHLRLQRIPLMSRLSGAKRFPPGVRYGDIVRGLPIPAAGCEAIYASHVLEHLTYRDCLTALRNTRGYLRPDGTFRLVVPDLRALATDYLRTGDADDFMRSTGLGRERRHWRDSLSLSAHLWMWDEDSMRKALADAGFVNIRRVQFGDDPTFAAVEVRDRFERALAMQAQANLTTSTL